MERREYLPYAIIETAFVFTDHRYLSLRPMAKLVFLTLWCRAFAERRSTIPAHAAHPRSLCRDTGCDSRTVAKMYEKCEAAGLIEVFPDGRIRVGGVEGKGNINWKDDPDEAESPGQGSAQDSQAVPVEIETSQHEQESEVTQDEAGARPSRPSAPVESEISVDAAAPVVRPSPKGAGAPSPIREGETLGQYMKRIGNESQNPAQA